MTKIKVRARAVDMLGRQQIAGIPNAIHELFKNAHDAYAEHVEVDYFRATRTLILRDDGYGMTRADVEGRWLTLGTESRLNANDKQIKDEWRGPKNPPKRSIMGEKGIGRLAVAVIAPITILMTRAARPEGLHNLIVALIHWELFELPGIDLSKIDVPIREIPSGGMPTNDDIVALAAEVDRNIAELENDISQEAALELRSTLEAVIGVNPEQLDAFLNIERKESLSLRAEGYGTHFIVLPVVPELEDDIDGGADREASKLERNLLGFSNYMEGVPPVISTEFRDHKHIEPDQLIGPRAFFTAEEFSKVDQYFDGTFDELGQFVGTVSIYGKKRKFVANWLDGKGRAPRCGPFSLKYGYVQGNPKESQLSAEDFSAITLKLEKLGGLYIYRDGIRVLPYGNSDVDWLDIERRRSKSAQDWYFSYRRGFGYISISHEKNGALSEKAGREGFRENQAYRDFRSILINFFQQLAFEFFRTNAPQGEDYWAAKLDLTRQAELLAKQKKKADNRRSEFSTQIQEFFRKYETNYFELEGEKLLKFIDSRINASADRVAQEELLTGLRNAETVARATYRRLSAECSIALPRGLALTKKLEREWSAYERMSKEIANKIFEPLLSEIDAQFSEAFRNRISDAQRIGTAIDIIEKERDSSIKLVSALRKTAMAATAQMYDAVKTTLNVDFSNLRHDLEIIVGDFARRSAAHPAELDIARNDVEERIDELRRREVSWLESLTRQMNDLAESIQSKDTLDDRFAALERRNQRLEEQIDFYSEFAQIGMAVGILQHEFERAASGIRVSMGHLKPWADHNPPLKEIYTALRNHIEHLDGYLKAIDPLGRRLHRSRIEISGEEVLAAVRRVFSAALEAEGIDLLITPAFREFKLECHGSALIGAFVNLVDNAIYWASVSSVRERQIILDASQESFLISNSGRAIEEHMREAIFEFGVSSKPGGRGMGLAVSREALRREGLELRVYSTGKESHPIFEICTRKV